METFIKEIWCEDTDWIHLALDSSRHGNQPFPFRTRHRISWPDERRSSSQGL